MTSAMILAAGLGTRLRPLTEELPKPLVWLGDRPMISHVIERLAGGGVARVVMNTHHLAEAFRPEVLASMPLPTRVLHEPVILGTAGGVANAAEALGDGDIVVWNGDILVDLDVSSLLSTHRSSGLAATLVVAPMAVGEGTVGLSASGDVVRLRGERFGEEASGGDFVGVQAMSEDLVDALPDKGCLVGDVYLPLLRCGVRLGSSRALGAWEDVGTVAAYRAANARWLARVYPGSEAFVGAGARVASGVDVAGSVIGSSAVVEGEGALRGCVVWPGARVVAPLSDAVVMSSGRVVRA